MFIYFIGVVLGSFYYGYVALQIPGGWLALKVGGTRLFGVAVLIASVLTILTPVAARASVILLIAVRIGEGLVLVSICCRLVTKRSLFAIQRVTAGMLQTHSQALARSSRSSMREKNA